MSYVKTTALLGLMTAILLAVGYFFAGLAGAGIALGMAIALNFVTYWYSDKIVLRIYRAKPLKDKRIEKMVAKLAKKAEIPKPKLYRVETDIPNAFATGRSPRHAAVAVTSGLMEVMDPHELEGVLAHELAHVKNRDTLISAVAATLSGALTWLAYAFMFSRERNALGLLFLFVLAPLAAALIRMAISRSREYHADRTGAIWSTPRGLASALQKIEASVSGRRIRGNTATSHMFIVNPFRGATLSGLFSTHPPTSKRVERLMAM